MRISKSVGAVVASSLLCQVAAQADYGDSKEGNDTGTPAGQVGSTQGSPITTASVPKSQNTAKTCALQGTTTVFVTVYPSNAPAGDGSPAGEAASDKTRYLTVHPTRTIEVSPFGTTQLQKSAVSPFTTITISDLWDGLSNVPQATGTSSESDVSPMTISPSNSAGSHPPSYDGNNGSENPNTNDGNDQSNQGTSGGNPDKSPYGSAMGKHSNNTQPASQVVITNTAVEWTAGPSGSSQVTVISPQTITIQGGSQETPNSQPQVTQWTITGPDGLPTVVQSSTTAGTGDGGLPSPAATASQVDAGSSIRPVTTITIGQQTPVTTVTNFGSAHGVPSSVPTTCTTYTVVGTDGLPTIVHSTWAVQTASSPAVTAAPFTDGSLPQGTMQASPGGQDITSCTSFTIIGSDGKPTVIESTLVMPSSLVSATGQPQNAPNTAVSGQVTPLPAPLTVEGGSPSQAGGVTTCTTFTVIGQMGRLTVVDSTYVIKAPAGTPDSGVITGIPPQATAQISGISLATAAQGSTTCITYTAVGADGRQTIVESTVVVPPSNAPPTASNTLGLPSVVPQWQPGDLPQGTAQPGGQTHAGVTTCITIDVLGPDGTATPVVETIVLAPGGSAPQTALSSDIGLPPFVPEALSNLPRPVTAASDLAPITTAVTLTVVGPNGIPSPVVQTIVLTPTVTAVQGTSGLATPSLPTVVTPQGIPSLSDYGHDSLSAPVVAPSVVSGVNGLPSVASIGVLTPSPSFTIVTGPGGIPVLSAVTASPLSSYANSANQGLPASGPVAQATQGGYGWVPNNAPNGNSPAAYEPLSSLLAAQATSVPPGVVSSTWVNVIAQPTTTYTMKFPFTTLATVASPARSVLRRQQSDPASRMSWVNSSATAVTLFGQSSTIAAALLTPTPQLPVPTSSSVSPMCAVGGRVGNTTVNFDSVAPGPLFNPSSDLWFSEGFLVAPPSTQFGQAYLPSSGSQLAQFVPPALAATAAGAGAAGDTAEIGMGPNSASPCFRFNLQRASLGCAAQGLEEWCEFEVSAYTYNTASSSEMAIAWSEVKRVPSCPSFPNAPCPLTPVTFDGYNNITSVLIRLHVGLELRPWWVDDLQFGWTDNSCEAATCRAAPVTPKVERNIVERAIRRGVWQWSPVGLQRLDDGYIWDSAY